MDILKKLNDIIWNMDTKNRMPLIMNLQKGNASDIHLLGLLDDTAKIRKTIISYFEDLILNSNTIQSEQVYTALIDYYKETQDINSNVITELIKLSRKNKFKNFHNQDILSEGNLSEFPSNTSSETSTEDSQGGRIKEIRTALKITQESMGKDLGISKQFLSRVENGIVRLSNEKLILFSNKYNANLNYVLTGSGNLFLN